MQLSYDYDELIDELKSDVEEGLIELTGPIKVVRSENAVFENCYPIIDYYYKDDECKEPYKNMLVCEVIAEMAYRNAIIK